MEITMTSTIKYFYLFSILSLFLFSCISVDKKPLKGKPTIIKSKNSSIGRCLHLKTGSVLKMNHLGKGVEELVAISPCKNSKIVDKRGRHWKTDEKGRIIIPKVITNSILLSPSKSTMVIDASLASRLFTQGYYFHSFRQFLGILHISKTINSSNKINLYFCSLWGKMQKQGAQIEKVLNRVAALTIENGHRTTLLNLIHGFKISYIGGNKIYSKPIVTKPGVSISMVTVKFESKNNSKAAQLLIVTAKSTDTFNMEKLLKIESIKWKKSTNGVDKGVLRGKIISRLSLEKFNIKFTFILIGDSSRVDLYKLQKSITPFSFKQPCIKKF
jgi:hypothetical protein